MSWQSASFRSGNFCVFGENGEQSPNVSNVLNTKLKGPFEICDFRVYELSRLRGLSVAYLNQAKAIREKPLLAGYLWSTRINK